MSTRSRIGMVLPDGTVESIYCHMDGYLKHNGLVLLDYYSDPAKLRKLLDLGGLSYLGKALKCVEPRDSPGPLSEGTKAYRRDMGRREPGTDVSADQADFWRLYAASFDEEFGYLLRPDGWVYRKGGTRNLKLTHSAINRERD